MAFSNALSGRMEELRFPNIRSSENDGFNSSMSSKRESNPFYSAVSPTVSDVRGSLQRRFTTDSSKLGVHRTSFGQHYPPMSAAAHFEQKQIIEDIQIARRKAQEQLALLDEKERRLQLHSASTSPEVDRFAGSFNRMSLNGPVSEPTTPPEYVEDLFSSRHSRGSRMSIGNITSPPGLSRRTSQTSSKVTSPPGNRASTSALYSTHRQSTKSMPGSRRGSDEEEEDYLESLPTNRSAAALNRFSMPVNGSRLLAINTLRRNAPAGMNESGPVYADEALNNAYTALTGGVEDSFPTLSRDGPRLSANLAAAEIAKSSVPEEGDYTYAPRSRPGHASMPLNESSMYRPVLSTVSSLLEDTSNFTRNRPQRHSSSMIYDDASTAASSTTMSTTRPGTLQTSFSSNDVPTIKNSLGLDSNAVSPQSSHAESQFHAHNVSLGRIPFGAVQNRQSRDLNAISLNSILSRTDDKSFIPNSSLQTSVSPFAPTYTSPIDNFSTTVTSPASETYSAQMYPYSPMQNYNTNLVTSPSANNIPLTALPQNQIFSRQDVRNGKRGQDFARLEGVTLESLRGQLYGMSKDQHGCRYMQRKLEDGAPGHVDIIFQETYEHIRELMTDPFGNYLCQKLFEHCSNEQRTILIKTASPALPVIALNQHGTRALQKMIEHLYNEEQINLIIQSLSPKVVDLVQDLNGNHVIQKCLQVLGAERSQFIYDRVGHNCVIVGTHRHGCCVLQRCIDHAQGVQRAQLVAQITNCAFDLVQDAFGNYVVQYILDLDEMTYTIPLCQSFRGKIVPLSKQKFSSNVIEKCLRVADLETRIMMIDEMLVPQDLERMLKDPYANYVVQTALDISDPATKNRMVEMIVPVLGNIKSTPHGRRIASKIQTMKAAPVPPMQDTPFVGRLGNRRQVQINGGGFVYGGRGMPTHPYTSDEYNSGQSGPVHSLGYNPGATNFAMGYNNSIKNGMGNNMGVGNYI